MKDLVIKKSLFLLFAFFSLLHHQIIYGQERGLDAIDMKDLKAHLSFLSSDELAGRATVEPEILIAGRYIASELKKLNIQAIDEDQDYFQNYTLINTKLDSDNSWIKLIDKDREQVVKGEFHLFPFPKEDIDLVSEVVFAGYGISAEDEGYNDYKGIDVKDKILIIMDRAPLDSEGKSRIKNVPVTGYFRSFSKLQAAQKAGAKAVIYVYDPKNEFESVLDEYSMFRYFLSGSIEMEGAEESNQMDFLSGYTTKLIFTERSVANDLLKYAGKTLPELQDEIDKELKPVSFQIPDITLSIHAALKIDSLSVPNVVGYVEGSDPELKNEVVMYSAHFDHLGANDKDHIYNGADDNGTGTTALLELAEAFQTLPQKPKRSILFLWVSGEEIGLFGSKFYSDHPIVPLEKTVVDINIDMIGRVKNEADTGSSVLMTDRDNVFVIGGHQSTELRGINNNIFKKMGLAPDYSLGDLNHPDRLYYRSDHINFARKDIPVLFFTTGLHADYHTVRDTYDRIDFEKFLEVAKLVYMVGYEVANRTERIKVDNPFSGWE